MPPNLTDLLSSGLNIRINIRKNVAKYLAAKPRLFEHTR